MKPTRQFGVLRAAGALDDEAGGVLDFWFDQGGRTKLVMLSTENSVGKSLPTSTSLQKSLGQAEAQIALAHEKVERLTAAVQSGEVEATRLRQERDQLQVRAAKAEVGVEARAG